MVSMAFFVNARIQARNMTKCPSVDATPETSN